MNNEINNYISKRYERWLDYATYHCSKAGMIGEAPDVLNEVLISVLQEDEERLVQLMNAKKPPYTELDFFVLKIIKLNIYSPTAPYRAKYKPIPVDENVEFSRIEIEDTSDEEPDRPAYILQKMAEIRELVEEMGFSNRAMEIFEFRFFQSGDFKEWDGPENLKELYSTYSQITNMLRAKTRGELIF